MKYKKIAIAFVAFMAAYSSAAVVVEKVEAPKKVVIIKIVERINYEEDEEFAKVLDELKTDYNRVRKGLLVSRRGSSQDQDSRCR